MSKRQKRVYELQPSRIEITGVMKKFEFGKSTRKRYHIKVDDIDLYVSPVCFIFVWWLCKSAGEWVSLEDMPCVNPERHSTTAQYIRLFMQEHGISWQVWESKRYVGYKLFAAPACRIIINPDLHFDKYNNICAEKEPEPVIMLSSSA